MKRLRLLGLLMIVLSLAILGASPRAYSDDGQANGQGQNNQGQNQDNNQGNQNQGNQPPSGSDHWRASATEIDTLGILGASLILASVYLIRRRSRTGYKRN